MEEVFTFDAINSRLQGHPDMTKTPGIDMASGSLGTGASPPLGMALAAKRLKKNFHTWVLLGDGEIQEGQVWEMAWAASYYKVDNLTAIVDYNKVQQFGFPKDGNLKHRINPLTQVPEKWRAFGWNVLEVDGHDFDVLVPAMEEAKATRGRPTCIIANTIKGKGHLLHGRRLQLARQGAEQGRTGQGPCRTGGAAAARLMGSRSSRELVPWITTCRARSAPPLGHTEDPDG